MGPDDYRQRFGDGRHSRARSDIEAKAISTLSNMSLTDPRLYGSASGMPAVSSGSAMTFSAFYACTRLMCDIVSSLPIQVLEQQGDRKVSARSYPLWSVLHDSPNSDQTPAEYVTSIVLSIILAGDHLARIHRLGGRLVALEPLNPNSVEITRRDGLRRYRWKDDAGAHDLTDEDVLHIPGFGGGPLRGMSVLGFARETLGLAQENQSASRSVAANGLRPSAVLSFDQFLTKEQRAIAQHELMEQFGGAMNAGKPFIAEGGVKLQTLAINPNDAQLLESRGFSIEEICRFFGVPPFMIGHTEKSTSWGTGLAEQVNGFHKFTLGPLLRKIQQRFTKQLIQPADRARYSVEFNVEGLLAADPVGRVAFYTGLGQLRAITVNEIRRLENLPPVPWGDDPVTMANNVAANEGAAQ